MAEPDYSYRDGLREAVAFLLTDRQRRVLLEWRPDKDGNHTDVFYPSGSIEMKDHRCGADYREIACGARSARSSAAASPSKA